MSDLRRRLGAHVEAGRVDLAWDEAWLASGGGSPQDRRYAESALRELLDQVHPAAWTSTRRDQARAVGLQVPSPTCEPGQVAFPVVGPGGAMFQTAMARVAAEDRIDAPAGCVAAIEDALSAVRAELGAPVQFEVVLTGQGYEGRSCGLAVALAAISAHHGLRVDSTIAATGSVVGNRVDDVGGKAQKLALRRDARPAGRLLVPSAWQVDSESVVPVRSLGDALERARLREVDLDVLLRDMRSADSDGRWEQASRLARELSGAAGVDDEVRLEAYAIRLAAANHLADADAAAEIEALLEAASHAGVDDVTLARAWSSRVVALVDRFDAARAREAMDQLLARPYWTAPAEVHVRGTHALLLTLEGRFEAALAARQANVEAAPSSERPRCLGDLADALLRADRPREAAEAVEQALLAAGAGRTRVQYLERTRAYLHLHGARARRALGDLEAARKHLDAAPALPGLDPRLRLELERALVEQDVALADAAWEPLRGCGPLVEAIYRRARCMLGQGDLPRLAALMGRPEERDVAGLARMLPY